jgi:1,2-diacylglycerol 3-beta-galactosyltransferase
MPKQVVFLMSDTGGGHRASANALVEALRALHGDAVRCQVVDLLTGYGRWPLSRAPDYYQPLVDRRLWLWRALWSVGEHDWLWRGVARVARVWQAGGLQRFADDCPADLYISVHPLLNHVPRRALSRRYPRARFATVVTDLASAARLWYDPGVDLLSASCPAVQRAALAAGVPAERVRLFGLPIRLPFSQPQLDPAQARRALGLEQRPTVLLLGGGAGMGALEQIAHALTPVLSSRGAQLAVICGRNEALRARLDGANWPMPTRIAGYVDDMPVWMAAASVLVTKAGPGTIAEALACGLPMVLSSYVPGQEFDNVRCVEENAVGVYRSDPQQIARVVNNWLEPANPVLATMRARALALARPTAALEIARALSQLIWPGTATGQPKTSEVAA